MQNASEPVNNFLMSSIQSNKLNLSQISVQQKEIMHKQEVKVEKSKGLTQTTKKHNKYLQQTDYIQDQKFLQEQMN